MEELREARYGPRHVGESRMMCARSRPSDNDGEMDRARF